jgi:GxxExxY protein
MHPDEITGSILEISIAVHRALGPGLLESVYEAILEYELRASGFKVHRQQGIAFKYGGVTFQEGYRVDLLVENRVVVEVKSVAKLDPAIPRQLTTYLRLMDMRVGLIINFGQPTLLAGVRRLVNRLPSFADSRVRVNREAHPAAAGAAYLPLTPKPDEPNLPASSA